MTCVLSLWKGHVTRDPLRAAIESIFAEVSTETGVSVSRMLNAGIRERAVCAARTVALRRTIQETGAPIAAIARKIGIDRKSVQRARDAA